MSGLESKNGNGPRQYVFGYGSLLKGQPDAAGARHPGAEPSLCELRHYRRTWNVAMENIRTLSGYKYYIDPSTGERPDWFVTFLNIIADPSATVNGVMFPVTSTQLERLDARERNYTRIDVSAHMTPPVDGRVWAYAGAEAAVRRFELGWATSRAVVSKDYYEAVLEDFASFDPAAQRRFIELTDPPQCPIVELQRVDVPDPANATGEPIDPRPPAPGQPRA